MLMFPTAYPIRSRVRAHVQKPETLASTQHLYLPPPRGTASAKYPLYSSLQRKM